VFCKYFLVLFLLVFSFQESSAQYDVSLYTSYTTVAERVKLKDRLIKNSITKGLMFPLSDSTEEYWEDAFSAMEVLEYNTPFTRNKVHAAFDSVIERSPDFQRALLELAYANYPGQFRRQTRNLLNETSDPKVFAMCSEYLIRQNGDSALNREISKELFEKFRDSVSINPVLNSLRGRLEKPVSKQIYTVKEVLTQILNPDFLAGQIVMYSFQRKDRNYPGMVLIRNAQGDFIRDSLGNFFHLPQLARSINNLPGYLRNGNTPQGIFKMYGFGVSMSNFIGPTANVQMGMPVELSLQKFFDDTTIFDTTWTIAWYQKLIPRNLKNYLPLYESYYAGLIGRTDIITHGTTIDPQYYLGKPYYPLTPTQGCLCTKEIWNGKRLESDQQTLINGLLKAGGANGYCVVVEIDDKHAPVTINDLLPYLPK
jgi:hypothetical protein